MGEAPFVSVVVPVYNSEEWIDSCVGSLLGQSFDDWELVLVDDCSTDGSLMRCKAYESDSRARVVSRPFGGGCGAARNTGLGEARGKYVYFLDSDDMLVEGALQRMVDLVCEHELDALLFGAEVLCEGDDLANRVAGYRDYYARPVEDLFVATGEEMLAFMVEQGKFVASSPLHFYRRQYLFDECVSYPEGIIYEDNLFAVKACLAAKTMGMIPDKLYQRRLRTGSIVTSNYNQMKNFKSNFTLATEIAEIAASYEGPRRVFLALSERAENFAKLAYEDYLNIARGEETVDVSWMSIRQKVVFKAFYETHLQDFMGRLEVENRLSELQERNDFLLEEHRVLLNSVSYRVGRALTAAPRAIRRLLG